MSENQTVNQTVVDEREPTPQEIKKMKENLKNYYKEQLDVLKPQVEVEELSARISEARLKKTVADMRLAQLMAPPQTQEKASTEHNGPQTTA